MNNTSVRMVRAAVTVTAALILLAACSGWDPSGNDPRLLPATPDFRGSSFETPEIQTTPSPLPTLTLTRTPTATAAFQQTPTPIPTPTYSPLEWVCVADGSPDPCHRALRDVAMRTDEDGWAVGERGVILHWDGTDFKKFESPVDITLRRVLAISADSAWAIGDRTVWDAAHGMVWRSEWLRWDGHAWRVFYNPVSMGSVVDVSFVTGADGWAILQDGDPADPAYSFFRWNGSAWIRFGEAPVLNALAMVAADDGWAVGGKGVILHWDGTQWSPVDSPTNNDLNGVAFYSADVGWAVSRQGEIIRYIAGQWLTYSGLAPAPRTIALNSEGGGWMLGLWQSGDVMLFWNGNDWVKYLGAFPDGEVLSIVAPEPGEAWAVGWIPGRSRSGMIWRWTSRGWVRALHEQVLPLRAADILSDNSIWAVGDNGITEYWNGSEWREIVNPTSQSLDAVRFLTPDDGWAAGEGGQFLHWDGSVWKVIAPFQWRALVDDGAYPHIANMAFLASGDGWAVGRKEGEGMLAPLLSHWDGNSWSEVEVGDTESLCRCEFSALYFSSPQEGWAVGGGESALFAHWKDAKWTVTRGPDAVRLLSVGGPAANDLWAAGVLATDEHTPNPSVLLHYDGVAWTEYARPVLETWLDALWVPAVGEGWLAGSGILHWTGSHWDSMKSPVDNLILAVSRTADGTLLGVTDNGVVLRLQQR
jgi:hypothetical protein